MGKMQAIAASDRKNKYATLVRDLLPTIKINLNRARNSHTHWHTHHVRQRTEHMSYEQ